MQTNAGRMVHVEDIPDEIIEEFRAIAAAWPGEFPVVERAIKDPGDPFLGDVLPDLRRLQKEMADRKK